MELVFGIALGIMLSLFFSFGPAFFSLLQTSVHYGFRKAVPFAYGVGLSDLSIVVLLLTVLSGVDMTAILHNVYVASIAGAVLIAYGIYTFNKRCVQASREGSVIKFRSKDNPKWIAVGFRGFILNFINPLIWIYWISIISVVSGSFDLSTTDGRMIIFFIGVLGATVSMDALKCRLASMLQRVLTPNIMNIVNKVTGIILIIFSVMLIMQMIQYQKQPTHTEDSSVTFVQKFMEVKDSTQHNHNGTIPFSNKNK